jgi:hypothetical protein
MREHASHTGTFRIYDNPGYSLKQLRQWLSEGRPLDALIGFRSPIVKKNLLMASQKLAMANAVYPAIDRLIITSQTAPPVDSETSYTGVIYEAGASEEAQRTPGNPYQVMWSIVSSDANGNWGSFVLVDAAGNMINRALAGVTKQANTGKIVTFTGSVTS